MSTTTRSYPKAIRFRRAVIIAVLAFVVAALASLYIWVMTAQTIAPPGLRILDFLWTTFSWLRA